MLTPASGPLMTAAAPRGVLGGHLAHTIEGIGFLVTALGGIAIAEFIGARKRRRETKPVRSDSRAPDPINTIPAGRTSLAVALRPARTIVAPALDLSPEHAAGRQRATLVPLVALAGAGAAAVHFVVMPDHFEEATLYGVFFAVAAASQLLYSALLLARPSRALVAAGAIGNLAILALWLVTRTVGIPLGPGAGEVEAVGGLDVLATGFELTVVVGAIAVLCRRRRPLTRSTRPSTWSPLIWALAPSAAAAVAFTAYVSPPS